MKGDDWPKEDGGVGIGREGCRAARRLLLFVTLRMFFFFGRVRRSCTAWAFFLFFLCGVFLGNETRSQRVGDALTEVSGYGTGWTGGGELSRGVCSSG